MVEIDSSDLYHNVDYERLLSIDLSPIHSMKEVAVVGHVHCLPSLMILIDALRQLGIPPSHFYLIPKPYSTIMSARKRLEEIGVHVLEADVKFRPGRYDDAGASLLEDGIASVTGQLATKVMRLKRLVILDDGGLLTAACWRHLRHSKFIRNIELISVQQTASGFGPKRIGTSPVAKIDIARSVAKKKFESKIIVDGVLAKIRSLDALNGNKKILSVNEVGIVGYGALGSRLAVLLRDLGKKVYVYDRAPISAAPGIESCDGWKACIRKASTVFGCTGANWLDPGHFSKSKTLTNFVSCSSRDVEFKSLLMRSSGCGEQIFEPLDVTMAEDTNCRVFNWGFPVNFDREFEWEEPNEIWLTRALLYVGVVQALSVRIPVNSEAEVVFPLSAKAQEIVVRLWLETLNKSSEAYGVSLAQMNDSSWWGGL